MTQKDESKQNDNESDPIEKFASGQTAFPNLPIYAKLAAENGELLTPSDLGGAEYDTNLRSSVEPLLTPGTTDPQNNLIGLRIHNQNDVLYQQHNGMQDAIEKSAAQLSNQNTLEPDSNIDPKPITLQDLLNTHIPSDNHHEILAVLSEKLNETQQKDIGNQDELTT